MADRMCQKCFVKFCAGDFLLDDAPQLCRQVDGDQIETLIESNQHYTVQDIASILQISKSAVENHLHQLQVLEVMGGTGGGHHRCTGVPGEEAFTRHHCRYPHAVKHHLSV